MNKWCFTYPRPRLKRDSFFSLNGKWLLNGNLIEVPFPREAKLSEYKGDLKTGDLVYEKTFTLPEKFAKYTDLIILHFGAVDQMCEVYLNDEKIGEHVGGYSDFEIDITKYLKQENNLRVICEDNLDKDYPYGKQTNKSKGMWYTRVSGIWQSVWVEAVPTTYVRNINVVAKQDRVIFDIASSANYFGFTINLDNNKKFIKLFKTNHIEITFEEMGVKPHLWSIDDPFLYTVNIMAGTDNIETYFAVRNIEMKNGYVYLNDEAICIKGVLDQGYFEDGLYIPGNPQEYYDDVLRMKELGFNTLRKHIKLEPEIFYYACDKLGMLVMQDMINSGKFRFLYHAGLPTIGITINNDRIFVNEERYNNFLATSFETIDKVRNHPCIFAYTIYNEGWGQQKADEAYEILKQRDPDRFFDATSGWFKKKNSDFDSYHIYFRNKVLKRKNKPLLLSECGGFQMSVKDHTFKKNSNYGYGSVESVEELTDKYEEMFEKMIYPSLDNGLMGYIITQVSDVENEINGFYTYDRQICKVNKKRLFDLNNAI